VQRHPPPPHAFHRRVAHGDHPHGGPPLPEDAEPSGVCGEQRAAFLADAPRAAAGLVLLRFRQGPACGAALPSANQRRARRRKGYALLEQQLERKVRGIAVPIRTRNAGVVGAIGISLAMEQETTDHAIGRALPLLQEAEYSLRTLLYARFRIASAAETGRLSYDVGRLTRICVLRPFDSARSLNNIRSARRTGRELSGGDRQTEARADIERAPALSLNLGREAHQAKRESSLSSHRPNEPSKGGAS